MGAIKELRRAQANSKKIDFLADFISRECTYTLEDGKQVVMEAERLN